MLLASDPGSLESLKHWLNDWGIAIFSIVNILLTAAIAAATVQQWKLGKLVYKLQESVERDRQSVWFFQRVKPQIAVGTRGAVLEISHLTESGAWIEQVRLVLEVLPSGTRKAHAIKVQTIVPSWGTETVELGMAMRELVKTEERYGIPVAFFVESQIWAKGKFHLETTNRHTVNVGTFDLSGPIEEA